VVEGGMESSPSHAHIRCHSNIPHTRNTPHAPEPEESEGWVGGGGFVLTRTTGTRCVFFAWEPAELVQADVMPCL
jgi:hypothetical protein